jgi:hypothetical protein
MAIDGLWDGWVLCFFFFPFFCFFFCFVGGGGVLQVILDKTAIDRKTRTRPMLEFRERNSHEGEVPFCVPGPFSFFFGVGGVESENTDKADAGV